MFFHCSIPKGPQKSPYRERQGGSHRVTHHDHLTIRKNRLFHQHEEIELKGEKQ